MRDQVRESGTHGGSAMRDRILVGPDFDAVDRERALKRRIDIGGVERHRPPADLIDHQRFFGVGVAQEKSARADQIRRRRPNFKKRNVEFVARRFMQQHMDHREQEGGVGLRLDRDPLGRAGARHREMRLDLHPLHAAVAGVGVALDPAHAARGLDIGAERQDVVAQRRVGADGESTVPQLAVQMFRVRAFDALPGAKAQVDGSPSRKKRRQRAHIGGGRSTAAEARGQSRKSVRIG